MEVVLIDRSIAIVRWKTASIYICLQTATISRAASRHVCARFGSRSDRASSNIAYRKRMRSNKMVQMHKTRLLCESEQSRHTPHGNDSEILDTWLEV